MAQRRSRTSPPDRVRASVAEVPPLTLTIPLYDEVGNVERVARSLIETFHTAGVPLVLQLVDNGSSDGTRAEVERLEREERAIRGIYLDRNLGYGGGILAGMRRTETPLLGYMWGDGQVEAADVIRVYRRLVGERADVAKARRIRRVDGWQRAVTTRVYNTVTLWLFHVTSTDANGCPKLFTRDAWERLAPERTDWFLDPEIMIGCAERGLKVVEVDVVARARDSGASKVGLGTVAEFCVNLLRRRIGG